MSTPKAFQDIAENFGFLEDWEDRYRYLIELGQSLPPLGPNDKVESNKVHGCASQVWLVSEPARKDGETVLHYRGESDAMIVRGLVAILLALYSGRPVDQIAQTDALALLDQMGLREHLTSQRANGVAAMVNRIRGEASAALNSHP